MIGRRCLVWWCFTVCVLGCTASHAPEDAPAPARDCSGLIRRDVNVLWITQNRATAYDAQMAAANLARPLLERIRERVAGTIRMASLDGHVSAAGILAPGACGFAGNDGVLTSTTSDGPLAPVVEFPEGPLSEASVDHVRALLFRLNSDECGNELLEAALRAITPSTVSLPLPPGASVHGDRESAALIHRGDVLVLLFASFMDDCSWNETVLPGVPFPCERSLDRCCDAVVYPTQRYIDGFRAAAEALGVQLVVASLTAVSEPDVPAAEWRAREYPLAGCGMPTTSVFLNMPYRVLEVSEALAPLSTSQSLCSRLGTPLANLDTIVDRIVQAACE